MRKKIVLIVLFVIMTGVFSNAFGQIETDNISFGKSFKIHSKIIGEEREIYVYLPPGYDNNQKEYPVLYLTDGSIGSFLWHAGAIRYFGRRKFPQMIMVAIPNTDRGRDLSPNKWEQLPNSGGGKNFLDFITNELIPKIENNFRTTDYRIIAGFSAGGNFVLYTMFENPDSFSAYIAASPSNNDQEFIMHLTHKFLNKNKRAKKFLFLPYYEGDLTICTESIPEILELIEKKKPIGFEYKVKIYKGNDHVPPESLLDGLLAIFYDWQPVSTPVFSPTGGVFSKDSSLTIEIKGSEDEIRYTINGSEPTRKSKLYSGPIILKEPGEIKTKSFRKNLAESSTATVKYDYAEMLPSIKNLSQLKKGIRYKYFEQQWFRLPDQIDAEPVEIGISQTINLNRRKKNQGFLFQFDGLLKIPVSGTYRFYMKTNATHKLLIGGKLIIDGHSSSNITETSYQIVLKKGFHPIRVLYTNCWLQGQSLEFLYDGPGIKKQYVSERMLFHK